MNDEKKTKKELIQELKHLRREISLLNTRLNTREELLVKALPMMFYSAEMSAPFTGMWVSDQVERITGFSPRQFNEIPDFWLSRIHPEDRDRVLKEFETNLTKGPVITEYRWLGANGYIWMRDHAVLALNARGTPTRVVGVWLDITERKEAEERLGNEFEAERLLSEISTDFMNVNSDAVESHIHTALRRIGEFAKTDHAFFVLFSEKQYRIKGVFEWVKAGNQPLGKSYAEQSLTMFPWIMDRFIYRKPVEVSTLHQLPEEATREREYCTAHGIRSFLVEPIYVDKQLFGAVGVASCDYSRIWFGYHQRVLQIVGEFFAATFARKEAEKNLRTTNEKLMAVLEASPLAIVALDQEAKVTLWSQGAEKLFGWNESEVMHQPAPSIPVEKREQFAAFYRRALEGESFIALETLRQKKDGTFLPVNISAAPLHDSKGNITGIMAIVEDISKRKQADQEIAQLSGQLSLILRSLPVAFFTSKAEGDYAATYMTENIKLLTGFEAHEFTSDPSFWENRIHPDDHSKVFSDLFQLSENDIHQSEYRWRVADDTYRWFHEYHLLRTSGEGNHYVAGMMQDITERKQAEEAVWESEQRYRALAESARDYIFIVDKDGVVQYVNAFGANEFGCQPQEIVGKRIHDLFPREIADRQLEHIQEVLKTGRKVANDILQVFPHRTVWIDTVLVPLINGHGETDCVLGISRDISRRRELEKALRQSEERYRTLAESSQDFVFIVDKDGSLKYINASAAKEFGCRPEDMLGKRIPELSSSELAERKLKNIQRVLETGEIFEHDILQVFPNKTVWMDTHLIPLKNEAGENVSVMGIARDITGRKEAEERLRKSEAEARRLADENRIIAEIGRVISSTLKIEEVYEIFAELMQKLISFDRISVSFNNLQDKTIRVGYLSGMNIVGIGTGSILPFPKSVSEQLLERRSGMLIRLESEEDVLERFPTLLPHYRAGIRSRISVPLLLKGEMIGAFHVESVKSNAYAEEDLIVMERIAAQISGAIANAQLFDELMKVEGTLVESEERYRSLVENATEGICVAQDGWFQFVNPRLEEITGFSQEELTSRPFADFIHPEDREMVLSRYRERLSGELVPTSYSFRSIHKNGEIRRVRINVTAITWNKKPATLNLVEDVTEQLHTQEELEKYRRHLEKLVEERTTKLAVSEQALSRSDQRYQEIIEIAQEGVWMMDASGMTNFVNHRMAAMLGYPAAEILSRPVAEFMAPEGHPVWNQLLKRCAAGIKDRQDLRLKAKEGKDIWVMVSSAPRYDDEGRFSGALLMVTDISERKEAVEKIVTSKKMLQRVFDGISEPLIMMDKDFVVRMLNETAKDYYKVESYQQIIGKPLTQDFLESDEAGREVRAAISEGRVLTFERRSPSDPNGFERVITYPLRENEGILGDAIIRISDITEARLLQREIIQNEKLASLGLLISSVAHEINNPNNFISFNIPVLRDYLQEILPILDDFANQHPEHELLGMNYHEFREDISKLLGNIEHGTARINTVVSNLREFSRKKDQEGWRRVRLGEVVEKGVAICAGELKKKVKSIDINVSENLPMVFTDPGAVEQILVNLLINAIQAMDKENSWIRVRVLLAPSETDYVQIEVSDNGCGMDENIVDRIFEPFFTTKPPGTGTGLGLYVSRNLILELGGDISVESQAGMGTTFTLQIPVGKVGERARVDSAS